MPYPNYHACRYKDPDLFEKDSFRISSGLIDDKPVQRVFAKLKSTKTLTLQSMRFPVKHWKEHEARAKCSGQFEPASK